MFSGLSKMDCTGVPEVLELYQQVGLMRNDPVDGLAITPEGYQYLLQDPFSQIWNLLLAYLNRHAEERTELLTFLFQLSFLRVGEDYAVSALSPVQENFVKLLSEFGLIFKATVRSLSLSQTGQFLLLTPFGNAERFKEVLSNSFSD